MNACHPDPSDACIRVSGVAVPMINSSRGLTQTGVSTSFEEKQFASIFPVSRFDQTPKTILAVLMNKPSDIGYC